MKISLTMNQLSRVEMAVSALEAISCLCAHSAPDEGLEQVNAHGFSCLLDILTNEIREGTRHE